MTSIVVESATVGLTVPSQVVPPTPAEAEDAPGIVHGSAVCGVNQVPPTLATEGA